MKGKAIVTGASQGIGKAIAEKLASAGMDVAICSRSRDKLEDLKSALEDKYRVEVLAIPADLSDKQQAKQFAGEVIKTWGHVDLLVNNAGIFIPGKLHAEPEGTLEKLMSTNLYSAYYVTRGVLPVMIQRQKGHIINICSVASIMAYPDGGSYAVTKFALLGFSKNLREELKPHKIRVTAVLPGATYTPSWYPSGLPESRFMPAEDIAEIVWDCYHKSDRTVVEEIILRPIEGDI